MRSLVFRTALVAGAALAVVGCSRSTPTNNVVVNEADANLSLSAPANDASAMESVANVTEPAVPATGNVSNDSSSTDTGGTSSGNNVESNTLGM